MDPFRVHFAIYADDVTSTCEDADDVPRVMELLTGTLHDCGFVTSPAKSWWMRSTPYSHSRVYMQSRDLKPLGRYFPD
jgi:hypothetical protein